MRIQEFWVVTKPNPGYVLNDILNRTTPRGLAQRVLGGLTPDEIHSIWLDHKGALWCAESLLEQMRRTVRACNACGL
jgi:hypothetical protein